MLLAASRGRRWSGFQIVDATTMLGNGLEVGKNLAGMEFIRQSVHHRMGGILGHFLHTILAEGAPHHAVGHAVKHTCVSATGSPRPSWIRTCR